MHRPPVSLAFTEDMHGFCSLPEQLPNIGRDEEQSYRDSLRQGETLGQELRFRLTIEIDDIEAFVRDPQLTARAVGEVMAPSLGGTMQVEKGTFNLFVKPSLEQASTIEREMHYTLFLKDQKGQAWTFYGYKTVRDGQASDVWQQTTTLYTRMWSGHSAEPPAQIAAQGILHLTAEDFARQMGTFKSSGATLLDRARALTLFGGAFMGELWAAYAPGFLRAEPELWSAVSIPVQTEAGVKGANISRYSFDTVDGLSLSWQRFQRGESRDVVLLLHGLTTSTDMFIMPEHHNLVSYLHEQGYSDVWSLDWRGSGRFTYNLEPHRFSLDDVAVYDIPAAIKKLREHLPPGARLHIIAHCVGAISTMLSLSLQTIEGLESCVINSVGLTPRVSTWSRLKLRFAPFLVEHILRYPYVSPRMPQFPGLARGKWLVPILALFHRECREPACHFLSFMWGTGRPAAYEHHNLSSLTHSRLADLFGGTSMNFYRHISLMVSRGEACPYKEGLLGFPSLPASYLEAFSARPQPRLLLISGAANHIFPGANRHLYEELKRRQPQLDVHYWEIPGYGHQDVFMGQHAARDVFPRLVAFFKGQGVKK